MISVEIFAKSFTDKKITVKNGKYAIFTVKHNLFYILCNMAAKTECCLKWINEWSSNFERGKVLSSSLKLEPLALLFWLSVMHMRIYKLVCQEGVELFCRFAFLYNIIQSSRTNLSSLIL